MKNSVKLIKRHYFLLDFPRIALYNWINKNFSYKELLK